MSKKVDVEIKKDVCLIDMQRYFKMQTDIRDQVFEWFNQLHHHAGITEKEILDTIVTILDNKFADLELKFMTDESKLKLKFAELESKIDELISKKG